MTIPTQSGNTMSDENNPTCANCGHPWSRHVPGTHGFGTGGCVAFAKAPAPIAGKADEMPEEVRAFVDVARDPHGYVSEAPATARTTICWLADALDRVRDQLECAEHERDVATSALDKAQQLNAHYRKMLGLDVECDPLSGRASKPTAESKNVVA